MNPKRERCGAGGGSGSRRLPLAEIESKRAGEDSTHLAAQPKPRTFRTGLHDVGTIQAAGGSPPTMSTRPVVRVCHLRRSAELELSPWPRVDHTHATFRVASNCLPGTGAHAGQPATNDAGRSITFGECLAVHTRISPMASLQSLPLPPSPTTPRDSYCSCRLTVSEIRSGVLKGPLG